MNDNLQPIYNGKYKPLKMKNLLFTLSLIFCFTTIKAQTLPEFIDKPAYFDSKTNQLVELEKSQYNTMAKAKGMFKAEGGFTLNGIASSVKITKQPELKFIVKITPGIDPTSTFDLAKFEIRKEQRVFITTTAKAVSTSTSYQKISFDVKKIKEGYYYLIAKNLDKGEYFFGSKDFMYAFSIQ